MHVVQRHDAIVAFLNLVIVCKIRVAACARCAHCNPVVLDGGYSLSPLDDCFGIALMREQGKYEANSE
jgi:hypothetical protein